VVIVVLNHHTMFKKGTGLTEVLMSERASETTYEADEVTKNALFATPE
jgi:hypothetical protein